jgi:CHAT domain-containing protein
MVLHNAEYNTLTVQLHQAGNVQSAVPITFEDPLSPADRSDLRWYLEDYPRFPFGIYPARARRIEAKMVEWGGAMFDRLFGVSQSESRGKKGHDFYTIVRDKGLKNYDFEVHYQSAEVRNFPWELLYDTESQFYLVHQFAAFARCQESSAVTTIEPHAASEQLCLLLVIARPHGARDVPYRTIARPVMTLCSQSQLRDRIRVEVLRPPTFVHFKEAVTRTRMDGSPFFDVVHFDGHGEFDYGLALDGEADSFNLFKGSHGKLLFETEGGSEDWIEADELRKVLGQHRIPLMVLNACRSGMEALEDPRIQRPLQVFTAVQEGVNVEERRERLAEQNKTIASVVSTLLDAGAHGVVGMSYVVHAQAAAIFMRGFYEQLLKGGSAAEAVSAGRLALVGNPKRPTRFSDIELHDWVVPVYNQRAPVQLFVPPDPNADLEALFHLMLEGQNVSLPAEDSLPPRPQFDFLGRDVELLSVERALLRDGTAGVTLTGLGGTGKTALALGCARWLAMTHARQIEGGVFFHGFTTENERGQAIHPDLTFLICAIGRQRFGNDFLRLCDVAQRTLVIKLFQANPCLLILDNAEAVCGLGEQPALLSEVERDEFRVFLQQICPPQGATRLLMTSRREEAWLGLNTEALDISGLDEDAAAELAAAVLRHHMGEEALATKRADAIWLRDYDSLLTALGGHPLALQIIIPHLKDHSPADVLQSFESGASWLDRTLPRPATERERTLAGCLNYSFSTLPARARRLLPFLAYFRDWVDIKFLASISELNNVPERIRGVTAAEWQKVLQQGESTGLVMQWKDTSFFHLHPLLPWFLQASLAESDDTEILEAVFRHSHVWLATKIQQNLSQGGLAEAAVKHFALNRSTLLHALTVSRRVRNLAQVKALFVCVYELLKFSGQRAQAIRLLEELAQEWQPQNGLDPTLPEGKFWLDLQLKRANVLFEQRDFAGADQAYQGIITAVGESGFGAAEVFYQLGIMAQEQRHFERAKQCYQRSLAMKLHDGDEHSASLIYNQLLSPTAKNGIKS